MLKTNIKEQLTEEMPIYMHNTQNSNAIVPW
jgi:hypothetical protein